MSGGFADFATGTAIEIMRRGFISYIQQGESHFAVPAWIMGGLETNVLLLVQQLFNVAVFSISLHIRQAGFSGFFGAVFWALGVLATAIRILWGPLVDELQP